MNLVWHIVKKDVRSARWLLVAFGLLQLSHLLLVRRWYIFLTFASVAFVGCGTAWFVYEDPLQGARARWVTMPIAPGRLRAAKLLSVVLWFWLAPSLIQAIALTVVWGEASFLPKTLADLLCLNLFVPAAAFLVAVLTHSAPRILLGFVAMMVFPLVLGVYGLPWFFFVRAGVGFDPDLELARLVLFLCGFLFMVGVVVTHQFHTRRTGRSELLALIGLGCLWALSYGAAGR